jgi:hypothetical protein
METNHKPNKKWRVYLILLALLCAIILFVVQMKKSASKKVLEDVEIEVEIIQNDSNINTAPKDSVKGKDVNDSLIINSNENIVPPSLQNNSKVTSYTTNLPEKNSTKQIEKIIESTKPNMKKLAIKEINLKLIKSANKPHSNYPFYNGGDEVLKGELYYLLKDNIVEQTVDKSITTIDFSFTITEDKNISEFIFKTDVSKEIQKKIIKELGNLNDWNTQYFKGNLVYAVELILL